MSNDTIGDNPGEPTSTEGSRAAEREIPAGDFHPEGTNTDALKDYNDATVIGGILNDDYEGAAVAAIFHGHADKADEFAMEADNAAEIYIPPTTPPAPPPPDAGSSGFPSRVLVIGGTVVTGLVLVGSAWWLQGGGESETVAQETPVATTAVSQTTATQPEPAATPSSDDASDEPSEPVDEELEPLDFATGDDPQGDTGATGSSAGGTEETQAGSDLKNVSYRGDPSDGTHDITIQTYGDSQAVAEPDQSQWFDLIVTLSGPDGDLRFNLTWGGPRESGSYQIRSVEVDGNRLNPNDVVIDAGWDANTGELVVSISGEDIPDNLDSMGVELGVRLEDGTDYYDDASFIVSGS